MLQAKQVLVLGGSSGIGLATAQAAAQAGAVVTIASRSAERLAQASALIAGNPATRVLDITDDAAVAAFCAETEWDHVVISAAQTRTSGARDMAMADAYAAMNSKFWGAFRVARSIRIRPEGSLTFVAGGLAHKPSANSVLQGAINAALESLGRGLAVELAPIRVNTLSPGLIDTPLLARGGAEARAARVAHAKSHLPARRAGAPEDCAQAILFLMTNRFATGASLLLDGGAVLV
jgi:NAD(P)-dependent dehydrogenase (short-subunit alcohol dehydrogenase family)